MVFKTALDNMLLEVALETQDLFVKLDVGGLELLLTVGGRGRSAEVVRVLILRVRRALSVFSSRVACGSHVGNHSHRGGLVFNVPDLVKVDVRDLFVRNDGRIMRGRISRQLREVL